MKWIDKPENPIPYFTFENLSATGFAVNAFTSKLYRKDGAEDDFLQLLMRKDSVPSEVENCMNLMLKQFDTDREHLIPSAQKHTANIHVVSEKDTGPAENRPVLECVDGMVTDIPGVMLQTFGADCPGIYLADPVHRAIGLCHSGRKGTQNHIGKVMLEAMMREYGTAPYDVLAAVSPGICVSCYEVGDDVAVDFVRDYFSEHVQTTTVSDGNLLEEGLSQGILQYINGRYHIDLSRSIKMTLTAAGIPADNIELSDICTKCRSDILYSFRAEGRISSENCALFMI